MPYKRTVTHSEWEKTAIPGSRQWIKKHIPPTGLYPPPTRVMPDIDGSEPWQPKEDDFVMLDNRFKGVLNKAKNVIANGRYIKFMPNSITLDTGFEVKAGDVLAQCFTYIAFDKATKDSKAKTRVSADISGKVEVIDHRKNKTYSVNCILFEVSSFSKTIFLDTLEGYTLIFRNVDDLKKVCDEEG